MVPHLPESLHLSLLLPRLLAPEPDTEQVYRLLAEPVREALTRVGVASVYGTIPRSFCDGRFNLVAGARKLAGTSQRWTGGLPGHPVRPGFVLAHLTLFVGGDMAEATRAVNRFLAEAAAGTVAEGGSERESGTVPRNGRAGESGTVTDPWQSPLSAANAASPVFDPHAAVTVAELMGAVGEPSTTASAVPGDHDGVGAARTGAVQAASSAEHPSLITQVTNALEEVLEHSEVR